MKDRMTQSTVLVTGGAGFIGSHAVLALLDNGWPVVVLDTYETGHRWAIDPRAIAVEGDIADTALVEALVREHDVVAVMHFAGSVVVPESVRDPLKYYYNNTAKSCLLLRALVAAGVRHVIFSSTAAAYGVPDSVPIPESARTEPINPYGRSKIMTEMMLADVAAAHPLNYCALRYFNVAGADPALRAGQATVGATHLIKVAVEAVTGKRDHVAVFGQDFETADGTGVRDYIHVSDLADAHLVALEQLMAEPEKSMVMNCGYGRGYSVLEVLDAVDRLTNRPVTRVLEPRRDGDPAMLVADTRRILAETRWRPKRDNLETIIRDALAWEEALSARGVF